MTTAIPDAIQHGDDVICYAPLVGKRCVFGSAYPAAFNNSDPITLNVEHHHACGVDEYTIQLSRFTEKTGL